jgi:hypothetical protein
MVARSRTDDERDRAANTARPLWRNLSNPCPCNHHEPALRRGHQMFDDIQCDPGDAGSRDNSSAPGHLAIVWGAVQ